MDRFLYLSQELQDLEACQMLRKCVQIDSAQGPVVQIDGRDVVLFCSNNYLNLANHPKIRRAAVEAIEKYGWGSASSRLISGTMKPHIEAQNAWASFFGKPAALFFNSGWNANNAILTALPQKGISSLWIAWIMRPSLTPCVSVTHNFTPTGQTTCSALRNICPVRTISTNTSSPKVSFPWTVTLPI